MPESVALYLQQRLREVGRLAQGDPATGGIARAQPTMSPTHHAANVHDLPATFLFSELRQLLHFQARPSPLSPRWCPPPPTPAPSPASTSPPRRVPTLHPQRSRRTGRTPVWHSSLGLPGGLISGCGQRDAPVEASAAISCLLGHHPRHLAPPPGPRRPHAPTQLAGATRASTLTEGACRPRGAPRRRRRRGLAGSPPQTWARPGVAGELRASGWKQSCSPRVGWMEDESPELGGPSGQSGAPLQIQSIPIRRQRPVPTFFAVTNCHHGDHHKKDSSQMQSFPGKFLPFSPSSP